MTETPGKPSPVEVTLEFTPNPNTLKYSINREIVSFGGAVFSRQEDAEKKSTLAAKLLGVNGITGVMIGRDFITITKTDEGDWDIVHKNASEMIQTFLESGQPVLLEELNPNETGSQAPQTETEKQIVEILDREIRPAVAMDGGDIVFEKYENGTVYLFLKGSCAGCPSATATLKQGIEVRLKEVVPEIQEVVSV